MGACCIGPDAAATVFPEAVGWLAAALTLTSFSMRSMVARRPAALAANPCIIGSARVVTLMPVPVLQLLPLLLDLPRLAEGVRPARHRGPDQSWTGAQPGDATIEGHQRSSAT